jgi:predicted dehydrogenase
MAITITYADGSVGSLTYVTGGDPAQGKERIEVHGAGRSAVLEDFRRLELFSNKRKRIEQDRFGQDKGHNGEWTALVRAIAGGEPSPIPLEQIIATTRITFLALESARTGTTQRLHP